ncbi:MAG TPA: hypothetical protein VFV52_16560 [Bacilli bacterium]|nr:hypothetical protein [Bacilli bacterium]
MKTPRWSVLLVALLLGLVTGDFLVHPPAEAKQSEVTVQAQQGHAQMKWEPLLVQN